MDTFNFDFNAARSARDLLETAPGQLRQMTQTCVREPMQEIAAAWKGENADRFIYLGARVSEELDLSVLCLNDALSRLELAISKAQLTEEAAVALAEARTYS